MSSKPNFAKIKNQRVKNISIQKKKMDIKKFKKKFSAKTNRRGSDDSKKKKKNINLTENKRNELKKEIKEEIQDSILKGVKNSEINIISSITSSLNNGFSFLGSLFDKSYEEFLKSKDKGINEGNSINSFDISYNNQNAGSFKISHNNSDNSRRVYLKTAWN